MHQKCKIPLKLMKDTTIGVLCQCLNSSKTCEVIASRVPLSKCRILLPKQTSQNKVLYIKIKGCSTKLWRVIIFYRRSEAADFPEGKEFHALFMIALIFHSFLRLSQPPSSFILKTALWSDWLTGNQEGSQLSGNLGISPKSATLSH